MQRCLLAVEVLEGAQDALRNHRTCGYLLNVLKAKATPCQTTESDTMLWPTKKASSRQISRNGLTISSFFKEQVRAMTTQLSQADRVINALDALTGLVDVSTTQLHKQFDARSNCGSMLRNADPPQPPYHP